MFLQRLDQVEDVAAISWPVTLNVHLVQAKIHTLSSICDIKTLSSPSGGAHLLIT
jgi:hypothetical protein